MVAGVRGVCGVLALALGACTHAPAEPVVDVQRAEDCPAVRKVSAWRNQMPPIPSGGAPLIVQVTFADLSAWQLSRQDNPDASVLTLALQPSDRDPAIATGFRERPREPARQSVVIVCAGEEIGRQQTITDAQ